MSEKVFPAKVVSVLNDEKVVINRGVDHSVRKGQRFIIYASGGEIVDPDTGENLGTLEILKGEGEVEHVQQRMSTLVSCKFEAQEEVIEPISGSFSYIIGHGKRKRTNKLPLPFESPQVGDYAKPV